MKRLLISCAVLLLVFFIGLWHVSNITELTGEVCSLLDEAQVRAESGDWDRALELTETAGDLWKSKESYLYVTIVHADTDRIHLGFSETVEFIRLKEPGEYSAANARLMTYLYLIGEMDRFTIQNIL